MLGAMLADGPLLPICHRRANSVADYQFQDSFSSSVPGANDIQTAGTGDKFVTETVGCTPSRVLSFPKGSGLQLLNPAPNPVAYTVVTDFRLADLSGYRRIMAPGAANSTFTSDDGLYGRDGRLAIFDSSIPAGNPYLSPTPLLQSNTYAEVALTVPGDKGAVVTAYFNGSQATADGSDTAAFNAPAMRFFKDNDLPATPNEDSAGAVARIRIYSGSPDRAEVAAIHDSGPLAGACNPAQARPAPRSTARSRSRTARHGRFVVLTGIEVGCPDLAEAPATAAAIGDQARGGSERLAVSSRTPKRLGKTALSVKAGKTKKVKVKLTRKALGRPSRARAS